MSCLLPSWSLLSPKLSFSFLYLVELNWSRSRKILKFLTCIASKGIAFLIDSDSFLEYFLVQIFIPKTLAFIAFFTAKINTSFSKLLGEGLKPSQPLASDGPADDRFYNQCSNERFHFNDFPRDDMMKNNIVLRSCVNRQIHQ